MSTTHVLRLLADDTRLRILHLVGEEPLTVAELQDATELGQSSISGHLAKLKHGGFLLDIPEGPSRRYRLRGDLPAMVAGLWESAKKASLDDSAVVADRQRLTLARSQRGRTWVDRMAGSLHREYVPGRTWEALTHAAFALGRFGRCADIGAGDGSLLPLIAPRCSELVCIEPAAAMREAGMIRAKELGLTVRWLSGTAEALPLPEHSQDTVLMLQCLHYCQDPSKAISEAKRILAPGGRLLILTLLAHSHPEAEAFGHRHRGFRVAELTSWLGPGAIVSVLPAEHRPPGFQPLLGVSP